MVERGPWGLTKPGYSIPADQEASNGEESLMNVVRIFIINHAGMASTSGKWLAGTVNICLGVRYRKRKIENIDPRYRS